MEKKRHSREISIKEASLLVDATGVRRDIHTALEQANLLRSHLCDLPAQGHSYIQAFTTSVLVTYSRAFSNGIRNKKIKEVLTDTLSESQRNSHDKFLLWRDKYIAHSVNSFETNYLYAEFSGEPYSADKIISIGVSETRIIGFEILEVEEIINLCDKFIKIIDDFIMGENSKILDIARNSVIEDIVQVPDLEKHFPDRSKVGRRRMNKNHPQNR